MLAVILSGVLVGCAPKTDRLMKKNDYPLEFKDGFLADCYYPQMSEEICQCTLEKIVVNIPAEDVQYEPGFGGVQKPVFSPEIMNQVTKFGMQCMPSSEIQAQMMMGCNSGGQSQRICECSIGYVVAQFEHEVLVDHLMAISQGSIPEPFMMVSEEAGISCMDPEEMKVDFVNACNNGGNLAYCECVYTDLYDQLGEEELKRQFFQVGLGKNTELYTHLEVAKEKCGQPNTP